MPVIEALVLDASAAFRLASADRFDLLDDWALMAPHLLLSETRSAFQQQVHRGLLDLTTARSCYARLREAPIEILEEPRRYEHDDAWDLAVELGWSKTYDAEYLGLARSTRRPICTFDRRLARAAHRIGVRVVELG